MAAPLAAQTANPPVESQIFRDWKLNCVNEPAGADGTPAERICFIHHQVRREADQRIVLSVGVRYLGPERKPFLIMHLPPMSSPSHGVIFAVDDGNVMQAAIQGCNEDICLVLAELPPEVIEQFKAGRKLILGFEAEGQKVRVDVPLTGFTKAMAALQETRS